MSIRGIVLLGLLDSPSEIVTLGLDPDSASPPTVPGIEWTVAGERVHWTVAANPVDYRATGRFHLSVHEE